ncbi:MAG: 1-(5-phosphoribosyl)-5-[(5-phosphoribosylamino)methylideneamino]imidazole-4-carboxamide isomerase [Deltaproteobacteria bacterium]|nr:1-(5-phosphoribosyl)-5-[(5-phosphoribosylamino)methylideneamino]imidazole-4-carboxamide isomerase [Deltaproteobacteria bacterium]
MIVIPAVDIKNGKCVRLFQGRMDRETVFSENPAQMAERWQRCGAERLHVVDLDGAVKESPQNRRAIQEILKAVSIPVQIGGGIRDLHSIESYLDLGLDRVILGTVAQQNPQLLEEACRRFEGKIVAGIDARNDRVAVQGWTETTAVNPFDLARSLAASGVAAIIFTDIGRDGMRSGPNIESTRRMCRTVQLPVICAGGIRSLDDVRELMPLEMEGLAGVITGRAIYEGTLDLSEALALVRSHPSSVPD